MEFFTRDEVDSLLKKQASAIEKIIQSITITNLNIDTDENVLNAETFKNVPYEYLNIMLISLMKTQYSIKNWGNKDSLYTAELERVDKLISVIIDTINTSDNPF